MRTLGRFIILGLLIEVVATLSFIGITKTAFDVPGKKITIIVFLIAIIGLLVVAVMRLSFRELMLLVMFLTVGSIGFLDMLSFFFFPSLAKDLIPFSLEHLERTGIVTILIFGGYMGSILMILAIKKLLKI